MTFEILTYRGEKILVTGSRVDAKPCMETVLYLVKDAKGRTVFASDAVVSVRRLDSVVKQEPVKPVLSVIGQKRIKV